MDFLKSILGERWRFRFLLFFIIYLALLFWPSIVFYNHIKFQPAAFTQEWIKSICSVSIIFLILEFQKSLFESNKKNLYCKEIVERKVINPLKNFLSLIKGLKHPEQAEFDNIILEWSKIYNEIKTIDMYSFNINFRNNKIFNFRSVFNMDNLNEKIIANISASHSHDLAEVGYTINTLIQEFEKEMQHLK